ncbi:MAG: hypothetical protein JWN01_1014 [Patescibacteria group bacterium]|nr:hypothetical protein [Patescibacteria group bacterium]
MMRLWQRLHPKTRLAQILLVAVVSVASAVAGALSVQAISGTLPDDNNSHFLVVSRYGGSSFLNAPTTYVKLIYPGNPNSVRIFDGGYCSGGRGGNYDSPSTPDSGACNRAPARELQVKYEFQTLNANGALVGAPKVVNGWNMTVNGWSTISLAGLPVVAADDQGNHLVRVKVYWVDPSPGGKYAGGLNAFKVDVNGAGAYVTYNAQDTASFPLAVIQRPMDLSPPYTHSDFKFQFAPDCDLGTATVKKDMQWYDADAGAGNQSGYISWDLHDDTLNQQVDSLSNAQLGGNSQGKKRSETFIRGHKYTWTWHHVDSRNGVELWMPFDSYNYIKKCYQMTARIVAPAGTLQPPGPLRGDGITRYTLNPRMHNNGPDTSEMVTMKVTLPICAKYVSSAPLPGAAITGRNGAGYGGVLTWPARKVNNGADSNANTFVYTVNPACDGQTITFNEDVTPSGGAPARSSISFNVASPHYPAIIGQSGDVHAGGGLCGPALINNSNTIHGHSQSTSVGEYVVSASGSVSGFGSNNKPGGSAATLGNSGNLGNYYAICRPDLVSLATMYLNNGSPYTSLNSISTFPNIDVTNLAAGAYFVTGGYPPGPLDSQVVKLHGQFHNKITIVVLAGRVEVDGPLTLGTTSTIGANVPSMGIIAANDLLIDGAATQVDAYLFSNGTINTCKEGQAAACQNMLLVNGFLMARDISFRRLGPLVSVSQATVGERINLTGQLYLNPPILFDSAATINLLQTQGERPPLN